MDGRLEGIEDAADVHEIQCQPKCNSCNKVMPHAPEWKKLCIKCYYGAQAKPDAEGAGKCLILSDSGDD
jgi:hypothetical protein